MSSAGQILPLRVQSTGAIAAQIPQTESADDMRLRVVLQNLDIYADGNISAQELARARGMVSAHGTTSLQMLETIVYLRTPEHAHSSGSTRRVALAALMGIAIGFDPKSAQALVDEARGKELKDVATFVAGELLAASCTGAAAYGAHLVVGKALAGATAKLVAIKAGAVTAGKGLLLATGWLGIGFGAVVVGAAGVRAGVEMALGVWENHADLLEPTYNKDQRILDGIKKSRVTLPNPAPRFPDL